MFQRTSITEWLHPAVPPVKTLPFFRKYFHSTIIASICSSTVATLAMSLWLSEFTAERVANVYAWVRTCLCVRRQGLDARTRRLAYSAFINREETEIRECVELERRRNVMKQDSKSAATAPRTCPHTASYSCLMAGLTELTLADEMSVQTQFDSLTQTLRRPANSKTKRGSVQLFAAGKLRCLGFSEAVVRSHWNNLHERESFSFRIKRPSCQIKREKLERWQTI